MGGVSADFLERQGGAQNSTMRLKEALRTERGGSVCVWRATLGFTGAQGCVDPVREALGAVLRARHTP